MNILDDKDVELVEINKDMDLLAKGAKLYKEGRYEEAVEYYRLSATLGNIIAISNLGYCYYYATGVDQDYTIARAYLELGAKHGDINSIYKLGDMYMNGDGVKKDEKKGIEFYVESYNQLKSTGDIYNYPDVLLRLAKAFKDGNVLEQNLEMAKNFLGIAKEGFKERLEITDDEGTRELYNEADSILNEIKQCE